MNEGKEVNKNELPYLSGIAEDEGYGASSMGFCMHFDGRDTTFSSILQMYCTKNILFYAVQRQKCIKLNLKYDKMHKILEAIDLLQ